MRPEIRLLLEGCDEDGRYEFPSNFSPDDVEKRARAVHAGLAARGFDSVFEDWGHNQNASFGLALIFRQFEKASGRQCIAQPVVRFSNFGNLATLTMLDLLPPDLGKAVTLVLQEHGFHYVPCDELHEEYDGVMAGNSDFPTWWVRYFDWL